MKLTASEFISKAEGLKSTELSLRQRLESLQSRHRSLESAIDYQEWIGLSIRSASSAGIMSGLVLWKESRLE